MKKILLILLLSIPFVSTAQYTEWKPWDWKTSLTGKSKVIEGLSVKGGLRIPYRAGAGLGGYMDSTGMFYYNTTSNRLMFRNSGAWVEFPNSTEVSGGGVTSIAGTTDQVNASASTGAVTLSLPQSIATTSTPTFAGGFIATATGSSTIVPTTLEIRSATNASDWALTPWGYLDFRSSDTSTPGVGVRARVGAGFSNTTGSNTFLGFFTSSSSEALTERMRVASNGAIGVGVTIPTARLHLPASTSTASTAPLKFTAGTLLTTPEAGAMNYDGTNFYLSPSTTLKRIPLVNNATPSNGQIPIGNGTDFTTASLTAGSNITITPGAGTITIASTGGGTTYTAGNGIGIASTIISADTTVVASKAYSNARYATISTSQILTSKSFAPILLTTPALVIKKGAGFTTVPIPGALERDVGGLRLTMVDSLSNRRDVAFLDNPIFTGTPSLPTGTIGVTQSATNNTTALATTAYVQSAIPVYPGLSRLILYNHTALTNTGSTTENTVWSGTVPVGSVGANGRILIEIFWRWSNNANTKTLRFKISGTTVYTLLSTTSVSRRISYVIDMRNSLTSQILSGDAVLGSATSAVPISRTDDYSTAIPFSITMQNDVSGDANTIESVNITSIY